jgi:rhodanese-related sulfurtransferase
MNILQFVVKYWYLFLALAAIVALLAFDFVRQAIRRANSLSPAEAVQWINRRDAVVLDVRKADEFQAGHVVGAINIPAAEFEQRAKELDKYKSRPIVVTCRAGQDAPAIAAQLRVRGLEASELHGGIAEWERAQLPVAK